MKNKHDTPELLNIIASILRSTLTPTAIGGNLSATTTRDYNNISTYCYYNHNHSTIIIDLKAKHIW